MARGVEASEGTEEVVGLAALIARRRPEWQVTRPRLVAGGIESRIFRAGSTLGPLALKVPLVRHIDNDNDQGLDARDLLHQDLALMRYLHRRGFPVPRPHALFHGDARAGTPDMLVYQYVSADGSAPAPTALGALLRGLHGLPRPRLTPVAQRRPTLGETLVDLIVARVAACRRLSGAALALPSRRRLLAILDRLTGPPAILHMDARPANLLTRRGRIVALLDWSNCLFGPAVLELARIGEYGLLSQGFVAGYGDNPLDRIDPALELVLRLYTASMLAVVFLSEAPDPARGRAALDRLAALAAALSGAVRHEGRTWRIGVPAT